MVRSVDAAGLSLAVHSYRFIVLNNEFVELWRAMVSGRIVPSISFTMQRNDTRHRLSAQRVGH